jgi:hypothetical protein
MMPSSERALFKALVNLTIIKMGIQAGKALSNHSIVEGTKILRRYGTPQAIKI